MSPNKPLCALWVSFLFVVSTGHAQTPEKAQAHVSAGVDASDDSDGFQEFKPWAQYETKAGWGVRASWQRYTMDGWVGTGRSLFLTHRLLQGPWSSQGRLGWNRTASRDHMIGTWDGMYQVSPDTAAGLSVERDVVNSMRGIERGLTSNTLLAVLDHQFHPRFSLGLAAGSTWFSDDNRRDLLRSRWTLTLSEGSGIYTYLSTRHYRNSAPYQGAYFAPERFGEAAAGLMWKKALTDQVVISAHADYGRQYIEGVGQRLWHWGLFLSSPNRAPIQWRVGLSTSQDRASSLGGSDANYRYTSAVASLRLPF